MAMVHTTWRGMYMNGVRIGIMRTTIVNPQLRTRQGRAQAHTGCCGVVIGATMLAACAWLAAAAPLRILGPLPRGSMCVRIELVTPDPCEARAFTSDEEASSNEEVPLPLAIGS